MNYPTGMEVPVGVVTNLIQETYRADSLEVPHIVDGDFSRYADSSEILGDDPVGTGLKLIKSSLGVPYVIEVASVDAIMKTVDTVTEYESLEHECEGIHGAVTIEKSTTGDVLEATGKYRLTASGNDFQKYSNLAARESGYFKVDPEDADAVSPIFSSVFGDVTYPLMRVGADGDIMRIHVENDALFGKISEFEVSGEKDTARLVDLNGDLLEQHVDGFGLHWDHLREAADVYVCTTPYLELDSSFKVQDLGLQFGDLCAVEFINPYTDLLVTLELPVLATKDNFVFVEWYLVVRYLNDQATIANDTHTYGVDELNSYTFSIKSFMRTRVLEKVDDVVSIPTLGFSTIAPEYVEGVDYTIDDGVISLTDYFQGSLTTEAGSPVIKFNPGFVRHQEIETRYRELDDPEFEIIGLMGPNINDPWCACLETLVAITCVILPPS